MLKFSDQFEKFISMVLLAFAMLMVCYQVVALIWNAVESFSERFKRSGLEYAPQYGKTIAILFFNTLLMMEIMQTIKVFSQSHLVKVRIILIVCLIAAGRKVLALGEETTNPMAEIALAVLILSLATGYFLVSRTTKESGDENEHES